MKYFSPTEVRTLFKPENASNGEDNGQLTIVGGSSLFKGAPLFSLKAASRIVDMVFFSSPEQAFEKISAYMHAELGSFIWVPFDEVTTYMKKSDAILIGPGFMRFNSEKSPHNAREHSCDDACQFTRNVTKELLQQFPDKKWVIDAGSLQTIDPTWIPKNAILTPNRKEFKMLFGTAAPASSEKVSEEDCEIVLAQAKKYSCIIVLKGVESIVASPTDVVVVKGGNPGLTKGGTGDTQAGVTAALLTKNEPFLSAAVAAYVVKNAAEEIYDRVGVFFNADDLAEEVPRVLASHIR